MMRRLFPNWGRRSMMGFLKHYKVLRDCEAVCITNSYRLMIWDCTLKDTPPGTPSERFTHVMLHLLPKCTAELTFGEFDVALWFHGHHARGRAFRAAWDCPADCWRGRRAPSCHARCACPHQGGMYCVCLHTRTLENKPTHACMMYTLIYIRACANVLLVYQCVRGIVVQCACVALPACACVCSCSCLCACVRVFGCALDGVFPEPFSLSPSLPPSFAPSFRVSFSSSFSLSLPSSLPLAYSLCRWLSLFHFLHATGAGDGRTQTEYDRPARTPSTDQQVSYREKKQRPAWSHLCAFTCCQRYRQLQAAGRKSRAQWQHVQWSCNCVWQNEYAFGGWNEPATCWNESATRWNESATRWYESAFRWDTQIDAAIAPAFFSNSRYAHGHWGGHPAVHSADWANYWWRDLATNRR